MSRTSGSEKARQHPCFREDPRVLFFNLIKKHTMNADKLVPYIVAAVILFLLLNTNLVLGTIVGFGLFWFRADILMFVTPYLTKFKTWFTDLTNK
jgi:hypothetical protein